MSLVCGAKGILQKFKTGVTTQVSYLHSVKMTLSKCCISGFNWDGKPTGKEIELAGFNTYVTGSNKEAAVLYIHDIFGWTFTNARLLADHYANEAEVTVYIPDL